MPSPWPALGAQPLRGCESERAKMQGCRIGAMVLLLWMSAFGHNRSFAISADIPDGGRSQEATRQRHLGEAPWRLLLPASCMAGRAIAAKVGHGVARDDIWHARPARAWLLCSTGPRRLPRLARYRPHAPVGHWQMGQARRISACSRLLVSTRLRGFSRDCHRSSFPNLALARATVAGSAARRICANERWRRFFTHHDP